jgi:hypothetical protein
MRNKIHFRKSHGSFRSFTSLYKKTCTPTVQKSLTKLLLLCLMFLSLPVFKLLHVTLPRPTILRWLPDSREIWYPLVQSTFTTWTDDVKMTCIAGVYKFSKKIYEPIPNYRRQQERHQATSIRCGLTNLELSVNDAVKRRFLHGSRELISTALYERNRAIITPKNWAQPYKM